MFPTNMTNHLALHNARQRELEAAAQNYHLAAMVQKDNQVNVARKHVGAILISLGHKLAQEPGQEAQLIFSTK